MFSNTHKLQIKFQYNSFDIGEMIYPGDEIYISFFSLPMYQSTDINQSITMTIKAPSKITRSLSKFDSIKQNYCLYQMKNVFRLGNQSL